MRKAILKYSLNLKVIHRVVLVYQLNLYIYGCLAGC